MTSTATLGTTYRSTLGAVSAVFDSAADTIGMGHRFIKQASENQVKTHAANAEIFDAELEHRSAMRLIAIEDEAFDYVGTDTKKQDRYNEKLLRIRKAISTQPEPKAD